MADLDAIPTFPGKDPAERLDYTFDFTNLLETAEVLTTVNSVTVSPTTTTPLVVEASGIDGTGKLVTVVLSGGEPCEEYTVTVNVTTDTGSPVRIFERSCRLPVEDR